MSLGAIFIALLGREFAHEYFESKVCEWLKKGFLFVSLFSISIRCIRRAYFCSKVFYSFCHRSDNIWLMLSFFNGNVSLLDFVPKSFYLLIFCFLLVNGNIQFVKCINQNRLRL